MDQQRYHGPRGLGPTCPDWVDLPVAPQRSFGLAHGGPHLVWSGFITHLYPFVIIVIIVIIYLPVTHSSGVLRGQEITTLCHFALLYLWTWPSKGAQQKTWITYQTEATELQQEGGSRKVTLDSHRFPSAILLKKRVWIVLQWSGRMERANCV